MKVLIVLTSELPSPQYDNILGVFAEERREQAQKVASDWMNACIGKNVYTGQSIGTRREWGRMAWVVAREVQQ